MDNNQHSSYPLGLPILRISVKCPTYVGHIAASKESKLNTREYHDGFEQPLCWLPHFPVFILVRPENLNLSLGGGDKN